FLLHQNSVFTYSLTHIVTTQDLGKAESSFTSCNCNVCLTVWPARKRKFWYASTRPAGDSETWFRKVVSGVLFISANISARPAFKSSIAASGELYFPSGRRVSGALYLVLL